MLVVMPFGSALHDHPRPALEDPGGLARHPASGGDGRRPPTAASSPPGTSRRATARRCSSTTARAAAASAWSATSACSPATATACSRSTSPATGRARGTRTGSATTPSPAIDAGLDWLSRRPDVDPDRIAGFGASLGAEVLIEAAARDPRLRAVVADGAARPAGRPGRERPRAAGGAVGDLQIAVVRGISGMRVVALAEPADRADRAAARAARGERRPEQEIPTNRVYRGARRARRPSCCELPDGRPTPAACASTRRQYEQPTTAFLDRALGR